MSVWQLIRLVRLKVFSSSVNLFPVCGERARVLISSGGGIEGKREAVEKLAEKMLLNVGKRESSYSLFSLSAQQRKSDFTHVRLVLVKRAWKLVPVTHA